VLVGVIPVASALAQPVLNVVAKSGDPVPNVANRTFFNFGIAYINNAGDVAFQANLGNASGQFVSRGATVRRQGVLRLIAQIGDPAPPGFPGSVFEEYGPSVSNLDEQGNVLVTSTWSNQFGNTLGYGTHIDTPDGLFLTIDPLTAGNPQWPALWTQFVGSQVRMGGGFLAVPRSNEIHGGPVTGPMAVLWQYNQPAPGWPCANAVHSNVQFNTMSAAGIVPVFANVGCGTWCGVGACASVIHALSGETGGLSELVRSCPEGANTPSGPVQCGPTGTRYVNSAFISLSGRTTWTRLLFNGDQILVRDGVDVGSLLVMATSFLLAGEEFFQTPTVSHIGEDGTIFVNYSASPVGGGIHSVGAFAVNPDGSTSHIGRYNEPVFPGGPSFTASVTTATNSSGILLHALSDGLYSWDRTHGWRRIIGPGDQVRLGQGEPVVSVMYTPSVGLGYQAGAGRGLNDSDVVAVSLATQIVGSQTYVFAVALIDLSPPVCIGDVNSDNQTNVSDFNILALNFGATVPPNTLGDLTGDGAVNVADFNILAGDFGCGS